MTPEELERTIIAGDVEGCVRVLAGATEPERRAAAPLAWRWSRAIRARVLNQEPPEPVSFPKGDPNRHTLAAGAAVVGTATLAEMKADGWYLPTDETACAILRDRRPAWLDAWAEWILAERLDSRNWHVIRKMAREGLFALPRTEGYYLGLMMQTRRTVPTGPGQVRWVSVLETLQENPDLLEDVWKLFEIEGTSEQNMAAVDKYTSEELSWSTALTTLAAEGTVSRERLLDASLDALDRDFIQFRAGWYSRLHERLSPTPEERAARCTRYLGLLRSRIPPTVSFALKALTVLDKAGTLPEAPLLDSVEAALYAREKSTVTLALRLIDRAARRRPELKSQAATTAVAALAHEASEVQAAALELIERCGSPSDAELASALRERIGDVAASQRPRLEGWLGTGLRPGPGLAAPREAGMDGKADSADLAVLRNRIEAIPQALREAAGIDAALDAAAAGTLCSTPLDLRLPLFPRLGPEELLQPVEGLDELIDLFAAVLENAGHPEEIERVLDGVSRLCGERPPDFAKRTGPLRKRAETLLKRANQPFSWGQPQADLAAVAGAWLTGAVPGCAEPRHQLVEFPSRRAYAVALRAAGKASGPLLAAPTHSGCWLDPVELVSRLTELQARGAVPLELRPLAAGEYSSRDSQRLELLQALLRLAPDRRSAALDRAASLRGEIGEAVRYALGAEGVAVGRSASLWATAARARNPYAGAPEVEARHRGLGPDGALAARMRLACTTTQSVYSDQTFTYHRASLVGEPAVPKVVALDLPAVLHYARIDHPPAAALRWCATVWPAAREAWFAAGAVVLANNLSWDEAEWGNRVFIEPLLDPDTHLGPMARTVLGLGLGAKEPGESGLATDALIAAVSDGRLTGGEFGETLAELSRMGFTIPARWAKTLGHAARNSDLHREVVRTGLEGLLASRPEMRPADLAALLGLFLELCVESGSALESPDARAFLAGVQGGKSGGLAKQILALTATGDRRRASVQALRARVERAERWRERLQPAGP